MQPINTNTVNRGIATQYKPQNLKVNEKSPQSVEEKNNDIKTESYSQTELTNLSDLRTKNIDTSNPAASASMLQVQSDLAKTVTGAQAGITGTEQTTPGSKKVTGKYADIINKAAEKYGVEPALVKAVIRKESEFNPKAVNKGAAGLMQLTSSTAKSLGCSDRFNPEQNINAGAKYLSHLSKKYKGNKELMLAAYNAGPGNVNKYKGVPPFKTTRHYVKKVTEFYNEYKT